MNSLTKIIVFLFVSGTGVESSYAQQSQNYTPVNKELYNTIAKNDSLLFAAFNACDIERNKSFFTEDLEFYHDKGGLTNYAQNLKSIISRCSSENKVRRELVPNTLEVNPIKDFGAIQIGMHRFYLTEKGKKEVLDGTFRFVHIWTNKDRGWKISRVVSFDH